MSWGGDGGGVWGRRCERERKGEGCGGTALV